MISIGPRRPSLFPATTEQLQPLDWHTGHRARVVDFCTTGMRFGLVLLGIGVVRIVGAVLFGSRSDLPSWREAVTLGVGYVVSFIVVGLVVGLLWPLRARRWGRVLVDYTGAAVLMAALSVVFANMDTSTRPMTEVGWIVCWAIGTVVLGTFALSKDETA